MGIYLPPDIFPDALRSFSLPNPAAVRIHEWIESSESQQSSIATLLDLMDRILRRDKPSLPPRPPGAVPEAANELKSCSVSKARSQPTT